MPRTARPLDQLTPEQRINRLRNQKAKEKRSMKPESNLITLSSSNRAKTTTSLSSWGGIGQLFLNPLTTLYTISIVSLSSYLAYQFHQFVDLTTGITVEFLSVVFGTMFSVTRGFSSFFSAACSILVIVYSSFCLHEGMVSKLGNNSDTINSLKTNREIVLQQINDNQSSIKALPINHTTKRASYQDNINKLKLELISFDTKIQSSIINYSIDYSAIAIRILAMLANLLLIHRFISYIKEK
tara:strand:+ start:1087 stop:1809 length:723 start_codon:yes stop_codon:yes gene_type:complete